VDDLQGTEAVAADLGFPVAFGVTREQGDTIGAFWEPRRDHIQPSEFLLTRSGKVLASCYSTAPVGRMDPEETLVLVRFLSERKR
jgi:hypothetical protein